MDAHVVQSPAPLSGGFEPGQLIVPVFSSNGFLGTAFFVTTGPDSTWAMTAKHVISGETNVRLAELPTAHVGEVRGMIVSMRPVRETFEHPTLDIAMMKIEGSWEGAVSAAFGSHGVFNSHYLNPELSPTRRLLDGTWRVRMSTNQGHVLRNDWIEDPRTSVEMSAMVVSWQAFRGASGSPVVDVGARLEGSGIRCRHDAE